MEEQQSIEPINKDAIHRISSGQVVLNLGIAVKELVENSIDALSTSIEVRLKQYGTDSIEVIDNGIGVREENFQSLTLKHYTSKLKTFNDLDTIATLGFRGEALSSLCALSSLTVITRHCSAEYATKITYDSNGLIVSTSPVGRDIGTTIVLKDLFNSLPVRRKEFMKNLKKEFNKMCTLLYAYCLISRNIRIRCINQVNSNTRTIVATEGSTSIKENIISVFGTSQTSNLISVQMKKPDETILEEFGFVDPIIESTPFTFEFFISSAVHGSGRSTTDRQFYFINSRPCEPNSLMKLVNGIYKQFNANQYPFVFLNIEMETNLVDVNVTPDKRQVFVEQEKLLLAYVKCSLLKAFEKSPSTFPVQNLTINSQVNEDRTKSITNLKRAWEFPEKKSKIMDDFVVKKPKIDLDTTIVSEEESFEEEITEFKIENSTPTPVLNITENLESSLEEDVIQSIPENFKNQEVNGKFHNGEEVMDGKLDNCGNDKQELMEDNVESDKELTQDVEETLNSLTKHLRSELKKCKVEKPAPKRNKLVKRIVTMKTSMEMIKEKLNTSSKPKNKSSNHRFRAEITPGANKSAEQELEKHITKSDFSQMEIIGQFNLGFIIAKLNSDLFIIDQHASDEKYNFEQLQKTTVLEHQTLINPKLLDLTVGNQELLIENLEVFEKNGFKFDISSEQILLTSIPVSKNCVFGTDDIDEMLFMLQNKGNDSVCRPSRIRAMFASRACRKSVMIGSPLSFSDMRTIVNHMGEIEHPWNCPHGRPTMRHLVDLKLVSIQ